MITTNRALPFKSIAAALLFPAVFGPIGLLYASFWGGIFMITLGIIVISAKLFFPITLVWIISCIWSVGAAESFNRKLLYEVKSHDAQTHY